MIKMLVLSYQLCSLPKDMKCGFAVNQQNCKNANKIFFKTLQVYGP